MKHFSFSIVALALAIGPVTALVACGDEPDAKDPSTVTTTTAPTPDPPPSVTETAAPTASETVAPTPPKPPPPTVEDMEASADPKPLPSIKVKGLTNEQSIADAAKAKDTAITLDVKNWELGKDGQHVHVILDGNPYKKVTDAKTPIKLGELTDGKDLTEGQHYLVVFPSRGTHESVKGKGASAFMTFWVGKKTKPAPYDGKKTVLVYSRPKGENFGDMGKSLLVDFYLVNGNLDKGDKVKFTVTGGGLDQPVTGEFTKWAPKVIKGLQKGDYEVKLELTDKDGKVSDLPWNTTTRKITVDADKPMDPSMGMAPMTMGAGSAAPATSSAAPTTSAKPAK